MSGNQKKFYLLRSSETSNGYSRAFPAYDENIIFKVTLGAVLEQVIVERRTFDLQYFREYLEMMKDRFSDKKYYDLEVIATQSYSQRLKEFFDGIEKYTFYKSAELADELDDYYLLHLNKFGDVVNLIVKSLLLGLGCAFELERKVSQSTVFFDYQSALFKHYLQMVSKLFGFAINLSIEGSPATTISHSRDTAKVPLGSQTLVVDLRARSDETLELRYTREFFLNKGCTLESHSMALKDPNSMIMPIRQSWDPAQQAVMNSTASKDTDVFVERLDALQNDYISSKNIYNPQEAYDSELQRRRTMFESSKPVRDVAGSPSGYIDLSAYYSANIPGSPLQQQVVANRVESLQYVPAANSAHSRQTTPDLVAHRFDQMAHEDPWMQYSDPPAEHGFTGSQSSILLKYQSENNFMEDLNLADSNLIQNGSFKQPLPNHQQSPNSTLTDQIKTLIEKSERTDKLSLSSHESGFNFQEDGADAGTLANPVQRSPNSMVQPFSLQPLDFKPTQGPSTSSSSNYRPFFPTVNIDNRTPQPPGTTPNPYAGSPTAYPGQPQTPHLASSQDYTSFGSSPATNPLQQRLRPLQPDPPLQIGGSHQPQPTQGVQPEQTSPSSATRDKQHQLDLLAKKRPTASVELLQQISDNWHKTKEEGANLSPSIRSTLQNQKQLDFTPLEARDSIIAVDFSQTPDRRTMETRPSGKESISASMTRKNKFLQNSESEKNCLICSKTQKMTQMYYYDRCFFCSNCYGLLAQRFKNKGLNNCAGCASESTKIIVVKFFLTNLFVKSQGSLLFTREKMMDKYFEYFSTCTSMPVKPHDLDRLLKLISNNIMTKVNTNAEVKVCSTCVAKFHVCSLCKFQIYEKEYFSNGKCDHGYCLDCLTLIFMKKYPHKKEFTCKGSMCWKKTPLDKALDYLVVKLSNLEEEFTGSREPRYSKV